MDTKVGVFCQVTLQDVTAFLSKQNDDKDRIASLEERTSYAIILLQALPCARFAVLEKLGEVFFDEAQHYIVDLERQRLEGMPPVVSEHVENNRDVQIKKIQQVLVQSIELNSKAWAPVIFQWSVQTLSQICGMYGTKRHFGSMCLEERLQMWLTCSATRNLMEITISSLKKIIHKNQDNCLKILMNATLSFTPYFDWALAHICCTFPDIIPYKFLYHALEAFSKQSRKAEVIKETMVTIFQLIIPQKGELVKDAILKLFKSGFTNVSEKGKPEQSTTLCIIPFLLHMAANEVDTFVPIIDQLIDFLSIEQLRVLNEQSKLREDVLQRGIVRRTVNCLKMVNGSSYKVLRYLIKYACMGDENLCKEDADLAKSVQNVCFIILECLQLQLKHEVHMYAHYVREPLKMKGDEPNKVPFLTSLAFYLKQCCHQMLTSSGTKKDLLQDFMILMAIQEGRYKMLDIIIFILLNSQIDMNKSTLEMCLTEFELQEKRVFEESIQTIFKSIRSTDKYSVSQVNNLMSNLLKLLDHHEKGESDDGGELTKLPSYLKMYVSTIGQVAITTNIDQKLALTLLMRSSMKDLRMSEYGILVQSVLHCYFKEINNMSTMENVNDLNSICVILKLCDELLMKITSHHKGIHHYIIRLLVQGILRKVNEEFTSNPEEPIVKVGLMKKNYTIVQENRFHSNITSILFKDGLKLNKRKCEHLNTQNVRFVHEYFMGTLFSLLSLNGDNGYNSSCRDDYEMKEQNFFTTWGDAHFARPFPTAYAYTATLLVELVCPETVPVVVWPNEGFLKFTIERDLKVNNTFEEQPLLWEILEIISTARPSLYHCTVLIQSLFGMSMKFWQSNRRITVTSTPKELNTITRLLHILRQAGWLPPEFDSIADVFPLIKPKELYEILSALWKYFMVSNFAPDRFLDRDQLGRPQLTRNSKNLQNICSVVKIIFFRNIDKTGHLYGHFFPVHSITDSCPSSPLSDDNISNWEAPPPPPYAHDKFQ